MKLESGRFLEHLLVNRMISEGHNLIQIVRIDNLTSRRRGSSERVRS